MRKRSTSVFSLAFLDIMFCGFGAVVLLVMLLHGATLQKREETQKDLKAEVTRINLLLDFARGHLTELKTEMETAAAREAELHGQEKARRKDIHEKKRETEKTKQSAHRNESAIRALAKEKAKLEAARKKRQAQQLKDLQPDKSLVGFDGEGTRQYLTGLKLGGEHTLILLDTSASMLDETIVNIVRRKLMSKALRKDAPKWQRAVRSFHWLIANLQPNKQFQIYTFNTEAKPAIDGTDGQWLSSSDPSKLNAAIAAIQAIAPEKGTSIHNTFDVINRFTPRPDSVLLLTDGLPTQRKNKTSAASITGEERLALFANAMAQLSPSIPINTLLFPIEGDPAAAAAYWALAIKTNGSFITPSRDWP